MLDSLSHKKVHLFSLNFGTVRNDYTDLSGGGFLFGFRSMPSEQCAHSRYNGQCPHIHFLIDYVFLHWLLMYMSLWGAGFSNSNLSCFCSQWPFFFLFFFFKSVCVCTHWCEVNPGHLKTRKCCSCVLTRKTYVWLNSSSFEHPLILCF